MKLGVSLYSFGGDLQTGEITVDEALRYCADLGCEGVEIIAEQHLPNWPQTTIADAEHIGDLCKSLNLEVFCFSIYMNSLAHSDREATFEEYVEMIRNGIAYCKYLGAKILRPAFYCVPIEKLTKLVEHCLPMLEENGIIWAVELHAPFPPAFYQEVLETIDSPWFRLIPDFSCWQTAGAAGHFQANDVSTLLPLLKYTVHCHGKAHVFDENGEEPNTPYQAIMRILKEHNFSGSVVAENEGWIFNYNPTREVVKTHFELLERYGR